MQRADGRDSERLEKEAKVSRRLTLFYKLRSKILADQANVKLREKEVNDDDDADRSEGGVIDMYSQDCSWMRSR